MKVKRYHLVSASDPQQLQNEVNKLIAEGWQPLGHLVITQSAPASGTHFFQTMVQPEGEIRS